MMPIRSLQGRPTNVLGNQPNFMIPSKVYNNRIPFVLRDVGVGPNIMSVGVNYSMHRRVLPCNDDRIHVLRPPPTPQEEGMVPATGIARRQIRGLAYDPRKPIDGPIMPLAGYYNAGMNNVLGQPR